MKIMKISMDFGSSLTLKEQEKNTPSKWPKYVDFEKKLKFLEYYTPTECCTGRQNFFLSPHMIDL